MADYVPSAGMKKFSATENSVTYILADHSAQKPHLVIFDRVIPVSSGKGSRVPQLRVRVIRGVLDANGVLVASRITNEFTTRYPVGAPSAENIADMVLLGSIVSNVDFQQDAAVELLLPL